LSATNAPGLTARLVEALPPAPRLAGLPLLTTFAVVLVTLLSLVFPTGSEYAAFTSDTKPDAYSIAYLETLTRANPKELELRLVYAKQLAALGRYDAAFTVILPVLEDARLGNDAKQFALDVGLARARAFPAGDPRRATAFADVHAQLVVLLSIPRPAARGEELAKLALELDDPRLAAEFYEDLAAHHPAGRARYLASAARWLRAAGDNKRAAAHYRSAHDTATASEEAIEYAVLAVASLEADNHPHDAADLAAEYTGRHPTDARILALATRLATACSRAAVARDLGRRWLALAPEAEPVMRAQAERELGAGDAKASLALLNKLVARHPNEYGLRYQRARVSEWAGDLGTAERDLLWLVAHRKDAP
jgi:hypothetical protein